MSATKALIFAFLFITPDYPDGLDTKIVCTQAQMDERNDFVRRQRIIFRIEIIETTQDRCGATGRLPWHDLWRK